MNFFCIIVPYLTFVRRCYSSKFRKFDKVSLKDGRSGYIGSTLKKRGKLRILFCSAIMDDEFYHSEMVLESDLKLFERSEELDRKLERLLNPS